MLHRDELTGLLNHGALMAELEYAVEYGRRHGGPLAFVVFDLDRFGEVHERFGQIVGDQILLHVANVFRSSVRASDVIGRYGGEEFAMILRGAGAAGAAVLAAKLRRVLGEQAATTAEGVIIPLNVSVGWAVYPTDGIDCRRAGARRDAGAAEGEDGEAVRRETCHPERKRRGPCRWHRRSPSLRFTCSHS